MSLINPDSLPASHVPQIDAAHVEFVALLNQMPSASNAKFAQLFARLQLHTEQHFNEENALMEQSHFPAMAEHKADHLRVLGELNQFRKRLDKGLVAFARAYVCEKLPGWFTLHIATMDSALLAHLAQKKLS